MDPVFPGYVLLLSPLPGLVWQLTQLASIDSVRPESVAPLAHIGYLKKTQWQHWDWTYSLPCWTWCSSWRCSRGDDSSFFPDANHLFSVFKSTSMEASFVWSTVSTLKPVYGGTVSLPPPITAVIIVNCSCLTDWKKHWFHTRGCNCHWHCCLMYTI